MKNGDYRGQAAALMVVDRRWYGQYHEDDGLIDRILSERAPDPLSFVSATTVPASERPAAVQRSGKEQFAIASKPVLDAPRISILELVERLTEEKGALGE